MECLPDRQALASRDVAIDQQPAALRQADQPGTRRARARRHAI
ncbi:Uncharacterized protein ToN1_48280 [Aromatoleum petrolei]|nr:Uncharacterized protein ToN1_48280 [Aromatoleum petrolei]